MWKPIFAFAAALLALPACLASDLTPTEMQWLRGAWPVIMNNEAQVARGE